MAQIQGKTKGKFTFVSPGAKVIGMESFGITISLIDPEERKIIHPQGDLVNQYGGGCITSSLKEHLVLDVKERNSKWKLPTSPIRDSDLFCAVAKAKAAADALETFLLALACEGFDMKDSALLRALEITVKEIKNKA